MCVSACACMYVYMCVLYLCSVAGGNVTITALMCYVYGDDNMIL